MKPMVVAISIHEPRDPQGEGLRVWVDGTLHTIGETQDVLVSLPINGRANIVIEDSPVQKVAVVSTGTGDAS